MSTETTIYTTLVKAGMTPEGACGLMGNMMAESAMSPTNLQNAYESSIGMTDEEYTAAVDNGTYSRSSFAYDNAGYGLCQWTYYSRKAALYDYAKACGASIGDAAMQAAFAVEELKSDYASLWEYLCNCTDIYTAASRVCTEYEKPAINNISARATYAQEMYDELSGVEVSVADTESAADTASEAQATELTFADALTNESVMHLQAILATYGYDLSTSTCASGVDGYIGKKTVAALKDFAARLEEIV